MLCGAWLCWTILHHVLSCLMMPCRAVAVAAALGVVCQPGSALGTTARAGCPCDAPARVLWFPDIQARGFQEAFNGRLGCSGRWQAHTTLPAPACLLPTSPHPSESDVTSPSPCPLLHLMTFHACPCILDAISRKPNICPLCFFCLTLVPRH